MYSESTEALALRNTNVLSNFGVLLISFQATNSHITNSKATWKPQTLSGTADE